MGVFSGRGHRLVAVLAASLLLGACAEGDPAERAARHLAAAEKAFAEGKDEAGMIELRNAVVTARAVALAARRNPRSFGCHFVKP